VLLVPTALVAGFGVYRHWSRWRRGRPAARFDRPWERVRLLLKHAVAQRRTARARYAGLFHALISYGFVVLTIATTVVALDAQEFDTGDMYNEPDDTMTVPVTGTYLIQGTVAFWADGIGFRQVQIEVNGTAIDVKSQASAGSGPSTVIGAGAIARIPAGATIRMRAYQNSGADLNTTNVGFGNAYLAAQWLAP